MDDKKRLIQSLRFPLLFLLIIWTVKIAEIALYEDFSYFGIYPRTLKGIAGISLSPFIHKDFNHLFSNTVPLLVLLTGIFYFFRTLTYRIFLYVYLFTGIMVWVIAREAYHIGASGLIYGFASFLFLSGVLRRDSRLLAISLLVVFLYGSMIWGIFPIEDRISWESHLSGFVMGIFLAVYYRKLGPQRKPYDWELEEEVVEHENFTEINYTDDYTELRYFYVEKKDEETGGKEEHLNGENIKI